MTVNILQLWPTSRAMSSYVRALKFYHTREALGKINPTTAYKPVEGKEAPYKAQVLSKIIFQFLVLYPQQ